MLCIHRSVFPYVVAVRAYSLVCCSLHSRLQTSSLHLAGTWTQVQTGNSFWLKSRTRFCRKTSPSRTGKRRNLTPTRSVLREWTRGKTPKEEIRSFPVCGLPFHRTNSRSWRRTSLIACTLMRPRSRNSPRNSVSMRLPSRYVPTACVCTCTSDINVLSCETVHLLIHVPLYCVDVYMVVY